MWKKYSLSYCSPLIVTSEKFKQANFRISPEAIEQGTKVNAELFNALSDKFLSVLFVENIALTLKVLGKWFDFQKKKKNLH
jgi:hypothetical protein